MRQISYSEKLENAFLHVSNGWFPPQMDVLEKIRKRLEAGDYDSNREELCNDLKEDFSLFTFCLRELSRLCEEKEGQGGEVSRTKKNGVGKKPLDLINSADLATLREVLESAENELSCHSIETMNRFQALRLREVLVSAATAETLAENADIDPELGFSCGILRQLGLTLISWNYPRVYSRAVETLQPGEALDVKLRRVLGFSPSLLGLTFARRWNLSQEVLAAMGERTAENENEADEGNSRRVGETLSKLCEVGEALARANDPEHYPTALHDWETAEVAVKEILGAKGMEVIFGRVKDYCKQYARFAPEVLSFSEGEPKKETIISSHYSKALLGKNIYLKHCSEDLREAVRELYSHLRPDKVLQENLRDLVFRIFPKAGFVSGCIYMLEPGKKVLSPVIRLGNLSKERQQSIILSTVFCQFDLVASSFNCRSPLREERVEESGDMVTLIAGSIGESSPLGVLYLESAKDYGERFAADPLPVFRALRQCLNDCLNLA